MDYVSCLNNEQYNAVVHNKGPLLILAGAGSGKTRVITYRIAYLIEKYHVRPYNILALTFTNKAAGEMRERVDNIIPNCANDIWISTFHSLCARILRRYIEKIGYTATYSIYDTQDQKTVIKEIMKNQDIDKKKYKESMLLSYISKCKEQLKTVQNALDESYHDFGQKVYANVYKEYEETLRKNNALDFDDLIVKTLELFKNNKDVLEYYQNKFKYIMVDEYQDTNHSQFLLVSMLCDGINEEGEKEHNLCVVGDDDQSIYKFRGADIRNILDFNRTYKDAVVVKLEQNYRSTKAILDVANAVICNNTERNDKKLWTDNESGDIVTFTESEKANEEAGHVIDIIKSEHKNGVSYDEFAILYRTNAQSRMFEEKLIYAGIPYKIFGGINFYGRKEIKDVLAYLHVLNNSTDDIQIKRIINVPKRGIGAKTISRIEEYCMDNDLAFYDALCNAKGIPGIGKAAEKLERFTIMIESLKMRLKDETYDLNMLISELLEITGYIDYLKEEETVEAESRADNVGELISKISIFVEESENPTLEQFLSEVSLVADIDNYDEKEEKVTLMTIHGSKGLEFGNVFLTGLEEGLFPSERAKYNEEDISEERRLFYVGVTRAQKKLYLSSCRTRVINGDFTFNQRSRFVSEIPRHMVKMEVNDDFDDYRGNRKNNSFEGENYSFKSFNDGKLSGIELLNNHPLLKKGFGNISSLDTKKKTEKTSIEDIKYDLGDAVIHTKFGRGIIKSMEEKDNDYIVSVEFDNFGVKKMKSSVAKLQLAE